MIYLTLATGSDRWDDEGSLKEQGRLWCLSYLDGEAQPVLKRPVADWCWENIGAYRIIEHAPDNQFGPDAGDSWRVEFKTDTDMTFFKMRWM